MTPFWRAIAIAVAVIVASNFALRELSQRTRRPGGPTSSSYATGATGLAAYADLLSRNGHTIVRVREALRDAELDPQATLVVLDPKSLTRRDARALRRFVRRGGSLVAGGAERVPWWAGLVLGDEAPRWDGHGPRLARPIVPARETGGINTVRTSGLGSWRRAEIALPVIAGRGGALLLVATVGEGRIALLADASPLQNALLDEADNALFGLSLVGPPERAVWFVESVHGFGRATGLSAIPSRWRWALLGLTLAALVGMVARGRRLGPPERSTRRLPPPRREYVEAVATLVAKTKRREEAVAPVQRAVRSAVARRLGLARDADETALRQAAGRLGLHDEEVEAVFGRINSDAAVVAAGRALARLEATTLEGER